MVSATPEEGILDLIGIFLNPLVIIPLLVLGLLVILILLIIGALKAAKTVEQKEPEEEEVSEEEKTRLEGIQFAKELEVYRLNDDIVKKFVDKNWDLIKEMRVYTYIEASPNLRINLKLMPDTKLLEEIDRLLELIKYKMNQIGLVLHPESLIEYMTDLVSEKIKKGVEDRLAEKWPITPEDHFETFIKVYTKKYMKKELHYFALIMYEKFSDYFANVPKEKVEEFVLDQLNDIVKRDEMNQYEKSLLEGK